MVECLKILINSKTKFTGKIAKTFRNDSLTFEFEKKEHAKKFIELFNTHKDLKNMLGQHNPFLRDVQGLGFENLENTDISKQGYTQTVANELKDYVSSLQEKDIQYRKETASVEGFKQFLEREKTNPNKDSAMIDQIVGEISHCETLHFQAINASQSINKSSVVENTVNIPKHSYTPSQQRPQELNTETRGTNNNSFLNENEKSNLNENSENTNSQDNHNISEYVKKSNKFNLIDEILERQNINFKDAEYKSKYEELSRLSKSQLFKFLGKEDYAVEAEKQEWRQKTIDEIVEKDDPKYRYSRLNLEEKTDEELSYYLHNLDEAIASKQKESEARKAYWEREKNKPNDDERSRIYNLGLKVTLLKKRMTDLGENGLLKDIPEPYIQSINNTIKNLLNLSDKTITGKSGQTKSVTEVIGELWDMRSEESIACVESQLASGQIQDAEVVNILKDFAIAKKLIPLSYDSKDYSCMPQSAQYNNVYNEWRVDFLNNTKSCYTIQDVYKKLDFEHNGEAEYFFTKKKDEFKQKPEEFASDENFTQRFLERMKEGAKQLTMNDSLSM